MSAVLQSKAAANASVPLQQLTKRSTQFDFEEFFNGHTRASGWFSDRFGRPRRHFSGDFFGSRLDGQFVLDEALYYTDGLTEKRQWKVNVTENGIFTAESESLIGGARGQVLGDTLSMRYSMKVMIEQGKFWDLDMRDIMVLQPDGSLHNVNHVYKWGIKIGTVSAHYAKHSGERICAQAEGRVGTSKRELFSV